MSLRFYDAAKLLEFMMRCEIEAELNSQVVYQQRLGTAEAELTVRGATEFEMEVASLVKEGWSPSRIAKRMGYSSAGKAKEVIARCRKKGLCI